jgi:bifunctional non-homologous end joining protein LigD
MTRGDLVTDGIMEAGLPRFIVQKHSSRSPHYDFRLEHHSVFVSWAIPRGLPTEKNQQRLALKVEDHDLSFWTFEGEIPEGEPGAGKVEIVDRGIYKALEWREDLISVELSGERARGILTCFRFDRGGPRAWLIRRG